jgi:hypothetical protein
MRFNTGNNPAGIQFQRDLAKDLACSFVPPGRMILYHLFIV